MDCDTTGPLLSAFADGELDEEEALGVRRHLAGCPRCAGRLETVRAVRAAVRDLRPSRSDEGLDEVLRRVRAKGLDPNATSPAQSARPAPRWLGIAAALALAVLVAVWAATGRLGDRVPAPAAEPPSGLDAGVGPERSPDRGPERGAPLACLSPDECGAGAEPLWPAIPI